MKHSIAATSLALALLLTAAPFAQAQNRISNADAERIALREVAGGEVVEIERDHERGRAVVEVTVRDARGVEHELVLDAETGAVIRRAIDEDDD